MNMKRLPSVKYPHPQVGFWLVPKRMGKKKRTILLWLQHDMVNSLGQIMGFFCLRKIAVISTPLRQQNIKTPKMKSNNKVSQSKLASGISSCQCIRK